MDVECPSCGDEMDPDDACPVCASCDMCCFNEECQDEERHDDDDN